MRKNILYTTVLSIAILFSACDSFLDTKPTQQIPVKEAFNTVTDADVALNGVYNQLGSYRFAGNYIIAIADFASDISVPDGSSGHFVSIGNYTIAPFTGELSATWTYGYKIISGATNIIAQSEKLLVDFPDEKDKMNLIVAQAYSLRAYAYFMLVNLYGLPYGTDNNEHGGLVLMDKKVIPFETNVSRSSVNDTYAQIDADIKAAETVFAQTKSSVNQYYFNKAALYALKSRVALFEKKYDMVVLAAEEALKLRESKGVSNTGYIDMWKSTAISEEDIFTVVKSNDDNLSANSINTLYGSYKGKTTADLAADFAATDIRLGLIDVKKNHPKKFDGIPSSKATSNIPQFRVSEMYLNKAEALANQGDITGAATALLYTAKRNTAITTTSDLPTDKAKMLEFIAKERKREFFQEGHRWYDARRTGETIKVKNASTSFDIQKFVYPIPSDEINSGFKCEQNTGWEDNLPE